MYDHFDRAYARHMGDTKQIVYNYLKYYGGTLKFKYLNHFKNYVETIYGVKLRA